MKVLRLKEWVRKVFPEILQYKENPSCNLKVELVSIMMLV